MSKKNKNKKLNNLASRMNLDFGNEKRDDEGFVSLNPTTKGTEELGKIKKRLSKVSVGVQNVSDPADPAKDYDPEQASEVLDELEDLMKAGKYGKGFVDENRKIVDEFVAMFMSCDVSQDYAQKLIGMTRKLLSICKSYYEYDEKQRVLIDNITYDGVLAKYLKTGAKEPVGIIPKGSKILKKTGIKYPTLHNNMDKAYITREGQRVPVGVKETDSLEAFLIRTYKALGLSSESTLALELSPKIDGVSVNGTIVDDMLTDPQTRGDENQSVAVMGLNGLEVACNFKAEEEFGIQYEAFVTEEDRIAASDYLGLEKPYVSCRHAAAGIIHRLSTMEDDGLLKFISLYPIATANLDGTYAERMDYIQNFGIIPDDMPKRKVVEGNMHQLLEYTETYYRDLGSNRDELSFMIDGMVVTVYDDDFQNIIGRDGRTNKFQLAVKFDPATAKSQVDWVDLDCGHKGYRTIQVHLKYPVFLDGVRYDHVPVPSVPIFNDLNLRYGSYVTIHRVGDVIPSITVDFPVKYTKISLPMKCPKCGEKLTIRNKKLFCENPRCNGNVVGRFSGFFNAMGLTGYGSSFAEMLSDKFECDNLADVIHLTTEKMEKVGEAAKKFPKLLKEAIESKRDYEILGAMAIPGIGTQKAKTLLQNLRVMNPAILKSASTTDIRRACIAALGENSAEAAVDMIGSKTFQKEVEAIRPLLQNETESFEKMIRVGHTGGSLSDELMRFCREHNMEVVEGKSFDILITSSMGRSSTKMDVAKKKNLPIYLEDDFMEAYKDQ